MKAIAVFEGIQCEWDKTLILYRHAFDTVTGGLRS